MKKVTKILLIVIFILLSVSSVYSEKKTKNKKVDFDFSEFSTTMLYAQLTNMLYEPDVYEGKTIKMKGNFFVNQNPDNGKMYYFIIVKDEMACCQQGMEFIWKGEHEYPTDYPPLDTEIEITGIFTTYEEDGYLYNCLMLDTL